jgi:hypothetical protein
MLYAGLDLSRKRHDFCLLDQLGEKVEVGAAAPGSSTTSSSKPPGIRGRRQAGGARSAVLTAPLLLH